MKSNIGEGCRWTARLLAATFALCLHAQNSPVLTRISTSTKDAVFIVDGTVLTGAALFTWPAGSKHSLEVALWQLAPSQSKTRYLFQHWSTPAGPLASPSNLVTITADASVPWYNADMTTEYAVSLNFYQCPDGSCAPPGAVWLNQVAYRQDADVWLAGGGTVSLEAVPGPGYVFAGWQNGGPSSAVYAFVLNTGTTVYPHFAVARAIQLVTIPAGLQLYTDRAPIATPATLEWGWNTVHTLDAPSPQWDNVGHQWILRSWSDGGALSHTYEVQPGASTVTLVGQFVSAVAVALFTEPLGLALSVDGMDGVSPRYLSWAVGDHHTVTAPLQATDSQGAVWAFRQWSNGGSNTQALAVTDEQVQPGIRLTATYDPLSRVRVDSVPTGLRLAVDGGDCRTPCEVIRPVGSVVHLTAPPSIPVAEGTRLDFSAWEGDGPTFTTVAGYRKSVAHYQTSYSLTLSADPAGAGIWKIAPASPDGYYSAGSSVSLGIDAVSGMKFRGWAQDLAGAPNPQILTMDAPHRVEGLFDKLPDKTPAPRTANAAGDTPTNVVAPGSIASLFGTNLADSTVTPTSDPLPQTLAGVSLLCSGHLLPLLFVSPGQINFQVPGDLQPGEYQLELHRANSPVVQVSLSLARNAPGLLVAAHSDGSAVTADSPAQPGEAILLYGTGLGPYVTMPMDGFRVPLSPQFVLADPVMVLVQGGTLSPDFAGAAAGAVGLTIVRVQLPQDLDSTAAATVAVQVGGNASNVLALPLKSAMK